MIVKQVRSWSKPEGVPNLIGRKRVDKSIFKYGSHIPIEFHVDFAEANGGQTITRGEARDVVLILDEQKYTARLNNTDRKGVLAETLQIRWDSNHELRKILEKRFKQSFQRFSETHTIDNGEEEFFEEENISELQEFIDFYRTNEPFQYRIKLITATFFSPINGFRILMQRIMQQYVEARMNENFGRNSSMWGLLSSIEDKIKAIDWLPATITVRGSIGQGNWAKVPWIAFLDSRITNTTQKGIYVVYVFREDMKGVYLTLMQGVTDIVGQSGLTQGQARQQLRRHAESMRESFEELREYGFNLDNNINLNTNASLGISYEFGTIAYRYYDSEQLPNEEAFSRDLYNILNVYDNYVLTHEVGITEEPNVGVFKIDEKVESLIKRIDSQGYVYEPWQIAAYIAALKTKPFVILAGVSGTES